MPLLSVSLPPATLTLLEGVVLMKYSNFVALTMLIYDFIITITDEIRLIWPWEWRSGKILYIGSRYSAFIDTIMFLVFWFKKDLTQHGCRAFFNAGSWFSTLGVLVAEWILLSRTCAIWGKSKAIVIPLTFMLLGAQTAGIYSLNNFITNLDWTLSPFTSISRCYIIVPKHNTLFLVYVLIMSVELVILVLTAWKGISIWRTSQRSNLVKVLYRDGVLNFAVLFAVSITNFAMCVIAPSIMREFLLVEPQRVLHSICTSRIILNLRDATSERTVLGFEPGEAEALSSMRFDNDMRVKLPSASRSTGTTDSERTMEFKLGSLTSYGTNIEDTTTRTGDRASS